MESAEVTGSIEAPIAGDRRPKVRWSHSTARQRADPLVGASGRVPPSKIIFSGETFVVTRRDQGTVAIHFSDGKEVVVDKAEFFADPRPDAWSRDK
jgi:hypothetical protein